MNPTRNNRLFQSLIPSFDEVYILPIHRRVQRVAEAIAHEGEAQGYERNQHTWEQTHMPVRSDVRQAGGYHFAEAGSWLVDAQSQETQARLVENCRWNLECHQDSNDRYNVGEYVDYRDPKLAGSDGASRDDEFSISERNELTSR